MMRPGSFIALLVSYDLPFEKGRPFEGLENVKEIETETLWLADRVIARAIAKIAFNYLAKISGATVPDFVFKSMFDDVRRFVRYDEGGARSFVQVAAAGDSLLPEDRAESPDHILAVKWEEREKGYVLGFVKLFGYAEYVIRLADKPAGIWLDVGAAHHYLWENRTVLRAVQGRFITPPPRRSRTSGIVTPNQ